MNDESAKRLAAKRATGNLSPEEEQILFRAAAKDQEVFNELMEEEMVRLALRDPESRMEIESALRGSLQATRRTIWERLLTWLSQPAGLAAAGAFAALLVVGVVVRQTHDAGPGPAVTARSGGIPTGLAPATVGIKGIGDALAADLFSLPAEEAPAVSLKDLSPKYRVGDQFRIRLIPETDGNIVIVQQGPDGAYSRLFPNQFHESPHASAGEELLIPPSGQGGWNVSPPAGKYRLRIVVLPESVDPLSGGPLDKEALRGKITVVEKTFEVED